MPNSSREAPLQDRPRQSFSPEGERPPSDCRPPSHHRSPAPTTREDLDRETPQTSDFECGTSVAAYHSHYTSGPNDPLLGSNLKRPPHDPIVIAAEGFAPRSQEIGRESDTPSNASPPALFQGAGALIRLPPDLNPSLAPRCEAFDIFAQGGKIPRIVLNDNHRRADRGTGRRYRPRWLPRGRVGVEYSLQRIATSAFPGCWRTHSASAPSQPTQAPDDRQPDGKSESTTTVDVTLSISTSTAD